MKLRVPLMILFGVFLFGGWIATVAEWHRQEYAAGVEGLEPRVFEKLTVVAVGTGSSYENHQRLGPCVAIGMGEEIALVDAGRAVAEALRASEIPIDQPGTVYLTSLLPENTVGLDDLLLTGWLAPRTTPLRVVGPRGTRELVDALTAAHRIGVSARAQSLGLPTDGAAFDVTEVEADFSETRGDLTIRAVPLPGGPLPALAYRFEAKQASAVVSGVGWGATELERLAAGSDILVHEAVSARSIDAAIEAGGDNAERLRREAALHTSLHDIGAIAERAQVGTLALVRLRPPPLFDFQFERVVAETYSGRVVIAADGDIVRR